MLRRDLEFLVREKILVVEGSKKSELQRRTQKALPSVPAIILDEPELLYAIHRDFSEAGAHVLVSATAETNRLILSQSTRRDHWVQINAQAVALCRRACREDQWVFGGLGTTGALLKPYGPLDEGDYRAVYREQAEVLIEAGVDGFILEGFSSLIEAEQCILGVRDMSNAPIVATMTFLEDGRTKFGDTVAECFRALAKKGADIVGVHGTLGPLEIDRILEQSPGDVPTCVRPNAGYPVRINSLMTYLSSPQYVAECSELFVQHGAVMVGGAAGFTADHIAAVATKVRSLTPKQPLPASNETRFSTAVAAQPAIDSGAEPRALRRKLGREPLLTVELEPPQGLAIGGIIDLLKRLQPFGIDAVNIPENPLARARISSIALARAIREQTGLESIAHLTCRDRNLISLQAELLGAHVLGVDTILALTGDPARIGDFPAATSIHDVDSHGLVEIMARMNLGKDFGMNDLGEATQFNIGIAANPLTRDLDQELRIIESKLKRGASFIQTQPIFDPAAVEPFLKAIERFHIPVIFGVMIVRDYRHATFLVNEYPGISIRESDLERFREGEGKARHSIAFARTLIRQLKPLSGGIYLMPSFDDAERLVEVLADYIEA